MFLVVHVKHTIEKEPFNYVGYKDFKEKGVHLKSTITKK
jgi:hypothetical protein